MKQVDIIEAARHYRVGDLLIKAVDNVSLEIDKGDFVSIVGHSGSGKTTLLSLMGGIIRPTSGKILFEGVDLCSLLDDGLSEYRNRKVGFMFQFASLLPILTAMENVMLPLLFNGGAVRDRERAGQYLELVGVSDKADAYPSQLSGGQQRRVAIARALMNDPEIILADEPTGDLDEETEAEIINVFRKVNREQGVTFVLVTHNLLLAKQANKMLRMSQGRLSDA